VKVADGRRTTMRDNPLFQQNSMIRRLMVKKYVINPRSCFYKKPYTEIQRLKPYAIIAASPQKYAPVDMNTKGAQVRSTFETISDILKESEKILRYKVNRLAGIGKVRSTYRAFLGWDTNDDENAEKIIEQQNKSFHRGKIKHLKQNNIFKTIYNKEQYLQQQIAKQQIAVNKRRGRKNFLKKLAQLEKSESLLKDVSSVAVLRRLNVFGNISSVVSFLTRDKREDKDKWKYYSGIGDAIKGGFDLTKDWVVKPILKKVEPKLLTASTKLGKILSKPGVIKFGKGLAKIGRVGARAVGALSFAADMSEVYMAKTQKEKAKKIGSALGGAGGALLGAKAGALLGTMIGGPVGTVIGGVVGGATGYLIGSGIGSKIANRFQKQVMSVWNPIEKYTRKQWKAATTFLSKKWNVTQKLWQKNKANLLKYAGGASAALLAGGPLGLISYATGHIVENQISHSLQKPKKSSSNPDLRTVNKVSSFGGVNNTDNIDCRNVAAQMISELNKVLQNKVISHTANYA
jgi:uncharacterized protein (DUF697 family)